MCKYHPSSTGFEGLMRSRGEAEAWYHERPGGDVAGEGTISVAVETPRVKQPWRVVEACLAPCVGVSGAHW